jgi:hypothetical protein
MAVRRFITCDLSIQAEPAMRNLPEQVPPGTSSSRHRSGRKGPRQNMLAAAIALANPSPLCPLDMDTGRVPDGCR